MTSPWPPASPAGPPPRYPPRPPIPRRRYWPAAVALTVASAAIAATATALISTQIATHRADSGARTPATVTLTATPSVPPPPAPLPTAQADRQTCNAWHAAGDKIHAATRAQSVIPKEMTVLDQAVRDNPDWNAAVHKAADLYGQAGDTLAAGIAPGTTVVLSQAATSAVAALHTLSTAYATFDVAGGNAYHVMDESAREVDVLCERLAPR